MSRAISGKDPEPVAEAQTGLPIDRSEPMDTEHVADSILQISGAGHWFLEDGSATIRWSFWLTRDPR